VPYPSVIFRVFHILLGRSWQFNKKTTHNGLTNEITFTHNSKKFVLFSLTPSQVIEDQVQMKLFNVYKWLASIFKQVGQWSRNFIWTGDIMKKGISTVNG